MADIIHLVLTDRLILASEPFSLIRGYCEKLTAYYRVTHQKYLLISCIRCQTDLTVTYAAAHVAVGGAYS